MLNVECTCRLVLKTKQDYIQRIKSFFNLNLISIVGLLVTAQVVEHGVRS